MLDMCFLLTTDVGWLSFGPYLFTDKIWPAQDVTEAIEQMWRDEKCHSYHLCGGKCESVSQAEKQRLNAIDDSKKKANIKPNKFRHDLLSQKYWSIVYVEGQGFFCILCKKYNATNPQNKSQTFAETPCVRFKEDALKTHITSKSHGASIQTNLIQKTSIFHKVHVEKEEVKTSVLEKAFSLAFFLMKEYIAMRKFIGFVNLMQTYIGVVDFKHFNHRAPDSVKQIFLTVGNSVKEDILVQVREAQSYGLLIDEVTDISVTSQLVTFVQFWNKTTGTVQTAFLSAQNVLEEFESCNADAISQLVVGQLQECGLDTAKFMGLATDGASVMVGKQNGVAAKLRKINPKLLNLHCVCHRLALASTDSSSDLKPIKGVEDVLRQLWYYFQNSPKKMAAFLKTQLALREARSPDEKHLTILSGRLKKACQTRWLSFDASVEAAVKDYEALLLTLQKLDDATAVGLLSKMKAVKFLGILYILKSVLPILSRLSKQFQADQFHFSMVVPATMSAIESLKKVSMTQEPLQKLQADIDSYTSLSDELCMNKAAGKELESLLGKYVDSLCQNMKDRLGGSPAVISSFSVFDASMMPASDSEHYNNYGNDLVTILGEHFFPNAITRVNKLLCQWSQVKFFLASKPLQYPEGCRKSTYLMSYLLKNDSLFHRSLFTELLTIAEIGLTLPCSNAWPERGASILKLTKTKSRNRLHNDTLNALMHASINGPTETEDTKRLVSNAVHMWLTTKPRKKLAKKKVTVSVSGQARPTAASHTDIERATVDEMPFAASDNEGEGDAVDVEVLQDQYELGVAASAAGLDNISDDDSAFESDIDD